MFGTTFICAFVLCKSIYCKEAYTLHIYNQGTSCISYFTVYTIYINGYNVRRFKWYFFFNCFCFVVAMSVIVHDVGAIASGRASLIFQERFQDAVCSKGRENITSKSCTRSNIPITKQTKYSKIRNLKPFL